MEKEVLLLNGKQVLDNKGKWRIGCMGDKVAAPLLPEVLLLMLHVLVLHLFEDFLSN